MQDHIRVRGKEFIVAAVAVSGDTLVYSLVGDGQEKRRWGNASRRQKSSVGTTKPN
jgi:hypothetical protein